MALGLGIRIGIGGGGRPVPGSLVQFVEGPTIFEVSTEWSVVFDAEQVVIAGSPTMATPVATFGGEEIIITG